MKMRLGFSWTHYVAALSLKDSRGTASAARPLGLDRTHVRIVLAYAEQGLVSPEAGSTAEEAERAKSYTYEALVAKPDMRVTAVDDTVRYGTDQQTRKNIVNEAQKNATRIGKTDENGGVSVYVGDLGGYVLLSKKGLRHGLDRRLQDNAAATIHAGEILQNAVRINELTPELDTASNSYVLLGTAEGKSGAVYVVEFVVNRFDNEVVSIDVLYSTNAKRESAVLNAPKSAENPLLVTDSTISIAQLLDFARDNFPDVLPESVLRHFGYDARPAGELGKSVLFSRDSRDTKLDEETRRAFITRFDSQYGKGAAEYLFDTPAKMARAMERAEKREQKAQESKTAAESLEKLKRENLITGFLIHEKAQVRKYLE